MDRPTGLLRFSGSLLADFVVLVMAILANAHAADYRGLPVGWPVFGADRADFVVGGPTVPCDGIVKLALLTAHTAFAAIVRPKVDFGQNDLARAPIDQLSQNGISSSSRTRCAFRNPKRVSSR